jgi:hypothetical protein
MNAKYLLYWLPMILLAVANGIFRQFILLNPLGELRAHQVSTLFLIVLCSIYVWLIFSQLAIQNARQALIVGMVWVVLTILFEFGMGALARRSLENILYDYHLLSGRIWLLFLVWLLVLPGICFIARN